MHHKFPLSWQKLPPSVRQLLLATMLTLLVHFLLLILFRQAPQQEISAEDKLLTVNRLDLTQISNQQLTEWLRNCDPALMTSDDHQAGYSWIMRSGGERQLLEDLPNPEHLSLPQPLAMAQLPENIDRGNLISPRGLPQSLQSCSEAETPAAVWLNGRRVREIELTLQNNKLPTAANPLQPTVFRLEIPRLQGALRRMHQRQSSGSSELDKSAARITANYLENSPEQLHGEIVFVWQNKNLSIPQARSKK